MTTRHISYSQLLETNALIQQLSDESYWLCVTRTVQESKLFPVSPYMLLSYFMAFYRYPELVRKVDAHLPAEEIGDRMRNMGIAPFNIASSVILITAQRLARRLCSSCKAVIDIPEKALLDAGFKANEIDSSWTTYRPIGCSSCNGGYKGRVGIYQVMPITEAIQRIILRNGSSLDIAQQAAKEGVESLRRSGLHKVKLGLTSLEEVLAVTNE